MSCARLARAFVALIALTVTAPAAGAATLHAPPPARVGRPGALTLPMPSRVAAVEGRVLVSDGAAEIVGAAPAAGGRAYRPVDIPGGAVFGAFDLRPRAGHVVLRLVVEPQRTGRIELRVLVDA